MLLSKACTYGIQAAVYAASNDGGGFVSISSAARELNIPFHFLTKVLQQLSDKGLLISRRGANGGVALARPASQITLLDIIDATDGLDLFNTCILGLPGCGHASPCPLHMQWSQQRQELRELFSGTSLASVVHNVRERSFRIASIDDVLAASQAAAAAASGQPS